MTDQDRRTARLRALLRWTQSVSDGVCAMRPDPDGSWVRWSHLAAVLDTEGDRQVCTCKPYGQAARKGLDPEDCPIHGNAGHWVWIPQ